MNTSDKSMLRKLRLDGLQAKKEATEYKYMYRAECHKNQCLSKQIGKLKKLLEISQNKCQRLIRKLCPVNNSNTSGNLARELTRKCKSLTQAKCDCTKRQRLSEYRHILFRTIQHKIPQCKRAQIGLWFDGKVVNYTWKSKDFREKYTQRATPFNFHPHADHSYASSKLIEYSSDEEDFSDIDYSSIFDSDGNWQKRHKRSIIHVMDSYRISHEAYHELRHAGKDHLPPLYQIRNEKILMSDEIPYIRHPSVRQHYIF